MSLVKTLVRKGKFNKWFDKKAAHTTNELYQKSFGHGVSRKTVRVLAMSHVFSIEEPGKIVAATMLSLQHVDAIYRIEGLAVDPEFRRKGYATTLLESIEKFIGGGATVWLCVDKGKQSTDWLVLWYRRMGFELAYLDDRLHFGDHEIPMKKLIK